MPGRSRVFRPEDGVARQKRGLPGASDFPSINAMSQVAASVMTGAGMAVDYQALARSVPAIDCLHRNSLSGVLKGGLALMHDVSRTRM